MSQVSSTGSLAISSTLPATSQADSESDVELHQVFKGFGREIALQGINLHIRQGEFFSILGPSGCGKTTTLRLIAGFETPSAGEVWIQGRNVSRIPAHRRPVNTVFQSYALFGHMTVWDNIAFGLRIKKISRLEIRDQVAEALRLVQMEAFAHKFPSQLSGGQQQRVALARALVNRPAVMLLDEPLGSLDLKLRKEMQLELSNLHRQLGITFVMVTHDQEEALSLSDRIAVMRAGTIEQVGTPNQIYDCPQTPFVADFIGDTNLLQGSVEGYEQWGLRVVTAEGLRLWVNATPEPIPVGRPVVLSIRPENIQLSHIPHNTPAHEPPSHGGQASLATNCFEGRIQTVMYLGTHLQYRVRLSTGQVLTTLQPNHHQSPPDFQSPVYVHWDPIDCLALTEPDPIAHPLRF